MAPLTTIILLSYNTRQITLESLTRLVERTRQREWQIIVVDNGSTDGSAEEIAQNFPTVELITSVENLGYAGGNNLGLAHAIGDAVVLLNSDIVVDPIVITGLAEYLQIHPDVGALSPRLLTLEGDPQPYAFGNDPTIFYLLRRGASALWGRGDLHDWGVDYVVDVDWVSGACLCVRREVLEQVGLLDDHFFLYFEDNEWCLRIRRAGWRVVYNPAWSVIHLGGASQPERSGSNPLYYDSLLYFYQKHYSWVQMALLRAALAFYRRLIRRPGS